MASDMQAEAQFIEGAFIKKRLSKALVFQSLFEHFELAWKINLFSFAELLDYKSPVYF